MSQSQHWYQPDAGCDATTILVLSTEMHSEGQMEVIAVDMRFNQ